MPADQFAFKPSTDVRTYGQLFGHTMTAQYSYCAPNQRQIARANQLTMLIVHGNEHYGNLVTYMRMKGIVPPSSAP